MNISFMFLQGVLALESFATTFCFTDEPGISFTGFFVLFKAGRTTQKKRKELHLIGRLRETNGMYLCALYSIWVRNVCNLDSELKVLWQREHWCALESPEGSSDSEQCKTLGKDGKYKEISRQNSN